MSYNMEPYTAEKFGALDGIISEYAVENWPEGWAILDLGHHETKHKNKKTGEVTYDFHIDAIIFRKVTDQVQAARIQRGSQTIKVQSQMILRASSLQEVSLPDF